MNAKLFDKIKKALHGADRNGYVAELHIQVIKYSDELQNVSGKDFCASMGLQPAWGTEFSKMKKIAPRLLQAGLDPDKL